MSKAFRPLLRHGARRGLPTLAGFSRGADASVGGAGHSRRDVLRFGAQGLAAALLAPALGGLPGCSGNSHKSTPAAKRRTIIVVGGGFSGLACADTLAHAGLDVIVLEATARPGGRVRTDRAFIPGDSVELGGEWIGRNHPTWLAYAQEFNLRLEEPGAAPQPEGVAAPDAGPTTGPAATPPDATVVPRPVPFETEMETAPATEPAAEPAREPAAEPAREQAPGLDPRAEDP